MSSDRAFSGASISRSRFRAIQRVSVDRPTPRFSANSRRVRPLVRARRTASSSNSCVNPFCFVIEFTFHPRKTLHFFEASPIRSERRLCEEVHLNLAYRWFCRLGLDDAVPEHSTFSKNRHGRFRESEAFRHVFETVLERCMSEGLVGGEGFAIDASVVKADAARASAIPGAAIDYRALGPAQASRAVREYLEGLDARGRPA